MNEVATRHALFYRALCGRDDGIRVVAGDPLQHPDSLSAVALSAAAATDDALVRVALAHRALHHLCGSFAPDLAREVGSYPRTLLAGDLYAVLEDVRVDAVADRLLPGLRDAHDRARRDALAARPRPEDMAPRAAVAETLVRFSLGANEVRLPFSLHTPAAGVVAAALPLRAPGASAEASLNALRRVYAALAPLGNVGPAPGAVDVLRFGDIADVADVGDIGDPAPRPGRDGGHGAELGVRPGEVLDLRLVPVAYRDVPGPRYRGLLDDPPPAEGVVRADPAAGVEDSGDQDSGDEDAGGEDRSEPAGSADRSTPDDTTGREPPGLDPDAATRLVEPGGGDYSHGEPLRPQGRNEFVYPEWDGVRRRYLPDWTLVRAARPATPAVGGFSPSAATRRAYLVPKLVRALERVQPAGRDVALRLPDGDDLDLDACVEAITDLAAGTTPSDRVHARLMEARREVAVAFAIDLSASTAVALPPRPGRPPERVVDLERDAVALVAEALERIGDSYGIWGFSGAGRDGVALSVVKELDEAYSAATRRRLASLTPDHTTRMGPVIRHLTSRLARFPARTRIMVVVSDGRPFDVDYGQQYGERAILPYAVADTAKALDEARARGIRPYLITVDPSGNDYLRAMCDPREYHVIGDAWDLPESLLELYVATSRATSG